MVVPPVDRFARHGEQPDNPNNAAVMAGVCERMYFLRAAIEAGGPDVTVDSFIAGAEALGVSFPSYTGLETNVFGPGQHAGGAHYRLTKYDFDCDCWHYTSPAIRAR